MNWTAPANCPQLREVEEQIRKLLGVGSDGDVPSRLSATGIIEPADGRFQLTLIVQEGDLKGKRVIESDECVSLGKAAAVVVGLLIRKELRNGRELSRDEIGDELTDASKEPILTSPTTLRNEPPPESKTSAQGPKGTASAEPRWRLVIHGPMMNVDTSTLPDTNYGAGLGVGVARGAWRGVVFGDFWLAQTKSLVFTIPYSAEFRRRSGGLFGCRTWNWQDFEWGPCAVIALDVVAASASGDRWTSQSRAAVWTSLGAGLQANWHLNSLVSLFLFTTARVATRRPEFVVTGPLGGARVHGVPSATFTTSLGFEWIY